MQDRARIFVQAGGGGDGCLSFRREAHVPKGGPDGGDGGRGGDVVLICDDSLRDLGSFRRRSHFKADRGGHGQGALKHGADGRTLEIKVPPGTHVTVEGDSLRDLGSFRRRSHFKADRGGHGQGALKHGADGRTLEIKVPPGTHVTVEGDSTLHDLVIPGQRAVVARGGSGGRGNKRFAGPTHQTPRFAERGLPGEETWLTLKLKLLADVGLVGLPNAGKSSLLGRLTRAHPKVADYPFTTLEPVLGTLERGDRQLVIADIPGLIDGASGGAGLGHDFLAHIERTRLIVHVLDLAPLDGSNPVTNHGIVERELKLHDPRLAALPRVLALSKADLVERPVADATREEWERRVGLEVPVIVTSAVTGAGLDDLASELMRRIELEPGPEATRSDGELAEHRVFRPAAGRAYSVERIGQRSFRVTGPGIERLIARYDLGNDEALAHLERRLRGIGVIRALEAEGFEPGDDVEIAGVEFELDPDM